MKEGKFRVKKVFINAGHGGRDCGAVSKNGVKEAVVSLRVCTILEIILSGMGFETEFYQERSTVNEVAKVENRSGADVFVSVHCNSFCTSNAHGSETLYYPSSRQGKKLAESVQKKLIDSACLYDRGLKGRNDLAVLKYTKAPAVLVEMGFLSNDVEERLMIEKPELFAQGIAKGIKEYLKGD